MNYTVDPDKAPELSWKSEDGYKGAKSETGGIVAILEMIKEDLENEIVTGRQMEAANQKKYERERGALKTSLAALAKRHSVKEDELIELEDASLNTAAEKSNSVENLDEETKLKEALYP